MKTRLNTFATLLFITAAGTCGAAAGPTFDQLDVNGDGQLNVTEAGGDSALSAQWSAVDTNQDGAINRTEFSAFESLQQKSGDDKSVPAGEEESGGSTGGAM